MKTLGKHVFSVGTNGKNIRTTHVFHGNYQKNIRKQTVVVSPKRARTARNAARTAELVRAPSNAGWPGYEPWFREIIIQIPRHEIRRTQYFSSWRRWRRMWNPVIGTMSLLPRGHGGGAPRRMAVRRLRFFTPARSRTPTTLAMSAESSWRSTAVVFIRERSSRTCSTTCST